MKYLAHRLPEQNKEQTVLEHLTQTAELAGGFAAPFGAGASPSGGVAKWLCSGLQSRVRRFDSDFRLHTIQAVSPYGGVAECLCDKGCNPYTGRLKSAPPPPRFTMPLCRALDIGIARMVK